MQGIFVDIQHILKPAAYWRCKLYFASGQERQNLKRFL